MIISRRTTLSTLFTLLLPASVFASPIFGTFDITGQATVMATSLDFLCIGGIPTAPCPGPANTGNFLTTAASGDFTPATFTGGYIHDLDQATTPPPGPFVLPNFIMFPALPGIQIDLTHIFLGVNGQADCLAAPAPGQTCTPILPGLVSPTNPLGLSPYNLNNLAGGGSSASFTMSGRVINLATGEESTLFGTLTSQFNRPFQSVLADILNPAVGSVTNSYSATFTVTPIPEPGTESLAIGTLLVLAGYGFRRKLRSGKTVH
jgi:hypothetical protein